MNLAARDRILLDKVTSYSKGNDAYWSFKGRVKRKYCQALVQ
jgi:hypothetical protein